MPGSFHLTVERLRIFDLRCLSEAELRLHPQVNWIVGPNAAGKTSILEAVHLLSLGRSFRTRHLAELIRRGAERCVCSATLVSSDKGGGHRIGIELTPQGRRVRIDGRPVRSSRELARVLRVRIVHPQSHQLVSGAPAHRRALLDWTMFHVEHDFEHVWSAYQRSMEQRNAALRDPAEAVALPHWERQMADWGERLHALRAKLVEPFGQGLREELAHLLPECSVRLSYRRGWPQGRTLAEALEAARSGDRRVGHSRVGPHRAELVLDTPLGPARRMLSQGQQKLLVLALLIAQFRLVSTRGEGSGMLLVDDLAAELDASRWAIAVERLKALQVQLLVTALAVPSVVDRTPNEGAWFHVEQGRVTQGAGFD